nr:hypothetical protein GCM10020063_000920 [Dactylosporangium thailandense]
MLLAVEESRRDVTVRLAAVNAVLAGCAPERFRVVVAALNAEVTEVHESGGVLAAVQVRDVRSAAVTDMNLAGLFVNSGMVPNTGLLESLLDEDAGRGFGGYAVTADGAAAATSARDFLRDQALP